MGRKAGIVKHLDTPVSQAHHHVRRFNCLEHLSTLFLFMTLKTKAHADSSPFVFLGKK